MSSRLNLESPDLEAAIAGADAEARGRVAEAVARAAVGDCELTDDDAVSRALESLPASSEPDPELAREVEDLVGRLDVVYWDLQEEADEKGSAEASEASSDAFKRARAANAVLYALSGDAGEAAYEAHHALQDPARLKEIVEDCLG